MLNSVRIPAPAGSVRGHHQSLSGYLSGLGKKKQNKYEKGKLRKEDDALDRKNTADLAEETEHETSKETEDRVQTQARKKRKRVKHGTSLERKSRNS